ncbi:MAG: hypothetical protein U0798_01470 [Gemmataceae bacterium]
MNVLLHLRRYLVLQSLLAWQGGFFFYATFVVPIGTTVLESASLQGAITQQVTNWLNGLGVLSLVLLGWDQLTCPSLRKSRWSFWIVMAACHAIQIAVHLWLDTQFDTQSYTVQDRPRFYFWHELYLTVAGIQWFAGLISAALMLVAWNRESKGTL